MVTYLEPEPPAKPAFSWKPVAIKAARGALVVFLLLVTYDPNIVGIANFLPEGIRLQATVLLGAALPAIRNTLKQRLQVTLGGLL